MEPPNNVSIQIALGTDEHTFDSAEAAVGFLRELGLIAEPDWAGGWQEVAKVGVPPDSGTDQYLWCGLVFGRTSYGVSSYDANSGWECAKLLPVRVSHWRPLPPPP